MRWSVSFAVAQRTSDGSNQSRCVTTFNGTGTTSMIGLVASKDGWRVTLSGPFSTVAGGITTNYSAERSVVNPTLFGGNYILPNICSDIRFLRLRWNQFPLRIVLQDRDGIHVAGDRTSTAGSNTNVTTKVSLGVGVTASALSVHVGNEGATLMLQMNSNTTTQLASVGDF